MSPSIFLTRVHSSIGDTQLRYADKDYLERATKHDFVQLLGEEAYRKASIKQRRGEGETITSAEVYIMTMKELYDLITDVYDGAVRDALGKGEP